MPPKKTVITVKDLIKEANEEWGEGTIVVPSMGGVIANEIPEVVSTSSDELDGALAIGGLPFGRIVEIMGSEASGKSTLALHVVANAQKMGKQCAYIDAEQTLDLERARELGVDTDNLAMSQPDYGEQALELTEFLIRSGGFQVIVVDSVAALIPKAELEGEMTDANIGAQARMMGKIMRKIVAPVNKNKVLVIFINQLRAKLGGFSFIPQTTTPGGNALKFYSSIRLVMARTGDVKNSKKEVIRTKHKVTIKKNKLDKHGASVDFEIGPEGIMGKVSKVDIV